MKKVTWKSFLSLLAAIFMAMFALNPNVQAASGESRESVLKNLVGHENLKARILWYDLSANIERLNTPEKVAEIVAKTAEANFNTIVLDVKNPSGLVAYPSQYAPHLSTSNNPSYANFPEGYDLIQTVVDEAKKYGLEVHLSLNIFGAGNAQYNEGPAMENPEWQTVIYDVQNVVTTSNGASWKINGYNTTRQTDYLVIYTPDKNEMAPSNRWGVDVQVENNIVVDIYDRILTGAPAPAVPDNGYVLSAHGKAREWVLNHIQVGETLDISKVQTELKPHSETNPYSVFMNPIHPEVREYTLNIIEELVTNYDIDGITLDRARYNNVYTDFSDLSREKFEEAIGQEVANWPNDIFTVEFQNNQPTIVPGPLYKEWFKWRAGNIHDFFAEAKNRVYSIDDDVLFNTYVGSWYPLYYNEGVNWGSKNFYPEYDWIAEGYNETGYADHLDFLMTGLYYGDVTIDELAGKDLPYWYSVEGAADISMEATQYDTFVYGSLYLLQYENRPEDFKRAIQMTEEKMHGIMLFDLVYIEMYDWWGLIKEAFDKKTQTPHSVPGLLGLIRE